MRDASEIDDDQLPVVDEVTGLANRRGFLEMLRMEERRQARYGGSPTLMMVDVERAVSRLAPGEQPGALLQIAAVLADATRDTDTLGRVDDYRFALLAIGAGSTPAPIAGRLRLFLELRGLQATVTASPNGTLEQAWRELDDSSPRPALRLIREDGGSGR
ncbi:MAG: diguanylate cyclase [Actinomycetota bacterium]|jgi:GGDEF domain-containing protein|nr:diguanylate cyclase [Actinomycetota bacterium]